jgi:hypothetical protein
MTIKTHSEVRDEVSETTDEGKIELQELPRHIDPDSAPVGRSRHRIGFRRGSRGSHFPEATKHS